MKIIDLTRRIEDSMPVFPGDPPVRIRTVEDGDYINSEIETGLHAGTHIDAPAHVHYGDETVDRIGLERLIGDGFLISPKTVKIPDGDIAVLKTGWTSKWGLEEYFKDYRGIPLCLAEKLVDHGVKGVCTDGPSVDMPGETAVHRLLLENGIWIVENIRNTDMVPKTFRIFVVPLNVMAEASPARVFAITD
ncbi:cyclase family protein [Methanothermobacter sp.]|uniref:cyclase family protein n=1 Tax=Methanothermobacter sp. TaxID=1884223 RepID=UPI0026025D7E|nr:cyclase family protein [Methanothermobacter sp.]MDI9618261.1 cyclase family protein [Methanothermobacter sp.]